MADAYIIDAVRTPRGRGKKGKGSLTEIHPQELLAQTLQELARRTQLDPADVDDVVVGIVSQVGEQGSNLARNAVLAADWPLHVGGVSLNRYCGSGLQAVNFAAMGVMSGAQEVVVGGGVESMSRVPMNSDGGEGDGKNLHLRRKHPQVPQGISADLIATMEGFTREELDAFALRSQQRAAEAQRECRFSRALLRAEREGIQLLAGKALHGGDQVGADALRHLGVLAAQVRVHPVALAAVAAHGHARHALHAAAHHHVLRAAHHPHRGEVHRLQAAAAEAVERHAAHVHGPVRGQHDVAGDVGALLAHLRHGAHHHVVHVDLRAAAQLVERLGQQLLRMDLGERSLALLAPPARRAHRVDDVCVSHCLLSQVEMTHIILCTSYFVARL